MTSRRWIPVAVAVVTAVILAPASALAQTAPPAATIQVTHTHDKGTGGCTASECTLREAIDQGRPIDTITVPAGRYLVDSELNPTGDNIVGSGAGATVIDAQNVRWRAFRVSGGTTIMRNVTVTGGRITGSGTGGFGGGVSVEGQATLTLSDSAVVGNHAANAGGIASAGTLFVVRSTISGNRAEGVQSDGHGGGIFITRSGAADLRNTTISGNTATAAGGGIRLELATLVLDNVTVVDNTAAIFGGVAQGDLSSGSTTLDNTLIARNSGAECGAGDPADIAAWQGDRNLDDDGSCGFTALGDLSSVDPQVGLLADNGGPTQTHALAGGSPAVNAGADCAATDQRGAARSGACDIGAFEYVPPPPPQQPSQPPPDDELPPPVIRKSVNMIPARGTIRIKRPGQKRFRKLADSGAQLPVGTTVDALKGRVTIVAASDAQGGTDSAVFYGGIFKISQSKGRRPTTILSLTEKLTCPKAGTAIAAAKKNKRRLWGDGSGKFRTKGKHSAATVVGTKWLVEDRCKSTLTRVVRGRVSVRDFAKKKTVLVRAGKRYVARAG